MKPSFKYAVIHRHRTKYAVKDLCEILQVSRSGYYKYVKHLNHTAKDFDLAEKIRTKQESCKKTYGYRRMKLWLDSEGITKNPKTILRIMHKYDLLSEIRRRKRWRKMGEDKHRYDNWLNREFNAKHPNQKWVTDISYIQTQEGVLYLSMIRDLYDRSIVAYRTGTSQTINLVLDTIHLAMKSVKTESRRELHLHSDQGFQYTSQAYFDLTKEYGILPSMSRRGNCYDNALAENFFGILKTECIYRHKPETFEEANKMIDDYIYFYKDTICTVIGLIGGAIAALFGGWDTALQTLVIFIAIDYITGLVVAGVFHASPKTKTGALESKAGWKGLIRKGETLLIVLVACQLDAVIGGSFVRDAAIIGFSSNEAISIVENAGLMGLPIPAAITKAIDILKQRAETPEKGKD